MHIRRVYEKGSWKAWFDFGCYHGGKYPCGKCVGCLKQKSNSWVCRLHEESKNAKSSYFVTLTYDDWFVPHLDEFYTYDVLSPRGQFEETKVAQPHFTSPYINICSKRDVQLWLKRFRKQLSKIGVRVRYFLTSEYGPDTWRPHYHAIIFLDKYVGEIDFDNYVKSSWQSSLLNSRAKMPLGYVETSLLTQGRIVYCSKYATTITDLPEHLQVKEYKPFMLCSRRPAIGASYLCDETNIRYHRRTFDKSFQCSTETANFKYALPKYYYYKIWNQFERFSIDFFFANEKNKKRNERYEDYIELSRGTPDFHHCIIEVNESRVRTKNKKRLDIHRQ